jgi:transposase
MLSLPASIRIFVARDAVDFRKAHDGLLAVVRDQFGDDPFGGSLFVFLNKRRDRVKLLQWDRDGFWLHYKRLERGTFRVVVDGDGSRVEMTRPQLAMLLEGIDLEKRRIRKPFVPIYGERQTRNAEHVQRVHRSSG